MSLGSTVASLQNVLMAGGRLSSADENVWLHWDSPNAQWIVRRDERGVPDGRVHYRGKNLDDALDKYKLLIAPASVSGDKS